MIGLGGMVGESLGKKGFQGHTMAILDTCGVDQAGETQRRDASFPREELEDVGGASLGFDLDGEGPGDDGR